MKRILISLLQTLIPNANPDYDHLLHKVNRWYIEYDDENGYVNREIGFIGEGSYAICLPEGDNVGYWADNNLAIDDFKNHFTLEKVSKDDFEIQWFKWKFKN